MNKLHKILAYSSGIDMFLSNLSSHKRITNVSDIYSYSDDNTRTIFAHYFKVLSKPQPLPGGPFDTFVSQLNSLIAFNLSYEQTYIYDKFSTIKLFKDEYDTIIQKYGELLYELIGYGYGSSTKAVNMKKVDKFHSNLSLIIPLGQKYQEELFALYNKYLPKINYILVKEGYLPIA